MPRLLPPLLSKPRRTDRVILPDGQITSCFPKRPVQPLLQKYFCFGLTQIRCISKASCLKRGALRNVINAGRDAVDAGGACDERCRRGRRSRVVLTPRSWRQVCEKTRR